jgi:hypothetical protein
VAVVRSRKGSTKGDKDKLKKRVAFTEKYISAVVDKKIDAKLKAAQNDHSHHVSKSSLL